MRAFIFIFILILLVLDDAGDELLLSFLEGMEKAPSLAEHLGIERNAEVMQ